MNQKTLKHNSDVLKHVMEVRSNLWKLIQELDERGINHDSSKLESPEQEIYAETNDQLGQVEYGTPEYKALMETVRPAIEHHYANNRHHPENHLNGVNDMDLVDVMEMLCDWVAATKRNKNGNIHKSIEFNTTRFNLSPQLKQILTNTVNRYF